jgi:predicted DsbA family dithiol-disulfide isomerase
MAREPRDADASRPAIEGQLDEPIHWLVGLREEQRIVRIEYVFDTICPWCYVGKRRFESALAKRPDTRADIRWRPFLLNPDLPLEGVERAAYLDRKFGGSSRVQRVNSSVAAAGRSDGIEFSFERISRTPNTLNSHRLIRFAATVGREADAVEEIYRRYFILGQDIGDMGVLAEIGETLGLSRNATRDYLRSDTDITAVLNDNARAHRLGVNGVPCLIIDGTYALAGAQEADILLRIIDVVRENQPVAVSS